MDKLQWFKFTPTDWVMGKIQKCPEVTQARFLRLCCLYWNKECNLSYEDAEIEIDAEHLEILINKKVVKLVSEQIIIEFLSDQLSDIESSSTAKSQGGLIGNLKRWHKPQYELYLKGELTLDAAFDIANQSHTDNIPIGEQSQNIADKIRVDKIRREKKRKDFIPPSVDEVKSYFIENGQSEQQAVKAFEYYAVGNWYDSKGNAVVNWKQKMRVNWFKEDKPESEKKFAVTYQNHLGRWSANHTQAEITEQTRTGHNKLISQT